MFALVFLGGNSYGRIVLENTTWGTFSVVGSYAAGANSYDGRPPPGLFEDASRGSWA